MPEGEPEKENPLGDVNAARTLASGVHFSCSGKGGVRGHLRARRWGEGEKEKKKNPACGPAPSHTVLRQGTPLLLGRVPLTQ